MALLSSGYKLNYTKELQRGSSQSVGGGNNKINGIKSIPTIFYNPVGVNTIK
jgi:hypothetical protein